LQCLQQQNANSKTLGGWHSYTNGYLNKSFSW